MNYYIAENVYKAGDLFKKTAWSKARVDVEVVLEKMGFKPINILAHEEERRATSVLNKMLWHKKAMKAWKPVLEILKEGDLLFIQLPLLNHSVLIKNEFKAIKKRGVHIIAIVHDLESIRFNLLGSKNAIKYIRLKLEEDSLIQLSDRIIYHNQKMIDYVVKMGVPKEKTINLEIFDYLQEKEASNNTSDSSPYVIIAGNLSEEKAGYIYHLPENVLFRLYGVNYKDEGKDNIDYRGAFKPDELIEHLQGNFGLVWDGSSEKTCEGIYGEYLKINNPHKTSLYLAAGIPVIIWKEAALAVFIKENNAGICIGSLDELREALDNITLEEYKGMKCSAEKISERLSTGYYARKAILEAMRNES